MIDICKTLIECTKDDTVKYDACRILAECYYENGQYELVEPTLEQIPEIYFTKLELMAELLEGNKRYEAAQKQKNISAESLVCMLVIIGKHLKEKGEEQKAAIQLKIAKNIIAAFADDYLEDTLFRETVCEYMKEEAEEIDRLLAE